MLAAYRQIKKDNEGFRERTTRNLERRYDQRHERLLLKFIDILDNLDRALEAAQISYAGEPLVEGMILVRTQLLQTLLEEGLERIPVLGMPFDPHLSESVGTAPVASAEHDHVVVKELMRGYRVKGRVMRPSRVVIGVYAEGATEGIAALPESVIDNAEPVPPMPGEELRPPDAAASGEDDSVEMEPDGPSIEEIVAKTQAQDALFPSLAPPRPEVDDEDET